MNSFVHYPSREFMVAPGFRPYPVPPDDSVRIPRSLTPELKDYRFRDEIQARKRLAEPDEFANGAVLDGTIPYGERNVSTDWELPLAGARNVYEGPVYYQGGEGTCAAWAVMHAMLRVGVEPTPALAKALLNAAAPNMNQRDGGVHLSKVAALLVRHDVGVSFEYPGEHQLSWESDASVARCIRGALMGRSALIAILNDEPPDEDGQVDLHAVAVTGYKADDDGWIALQVIDSGRGEYATTAGALVKDWTDSGIAGKSTRP